MSYDTWKLQTPEEYFGAITLTCAECGDDFDTYDEDDEVCNTCLWNDYRDPSPYQTNKNEENENENV